MNTLKTATVVAFPVLVLLSCNTHKNHEANKPTDNLEIRPAVPASHAMLNLAAYADDFMQTVKQEFTVKGKHKTVITAKGGLRVTVNAADLVKENGMPVDGDIRVNIIELASSKDFFYSNAATISDGRLLSSGGSYYVGMLCNGYRLELKKGRSMMIDFPILRKEDMELFYGKRDEKNNMNWRKMNMVLTMPPESVSFTDSSYSSEVFNFRNDLEEFRTGRLFQSLKDPISYYGKEITLQRFVDTLNAVKPIVYLETISFWPKNLPTDRVLDTAFLIATYGPMKQYVLRSCKQLEQEEQERERRKQLQAARFSKWEPRSLAGQIQKYYAPVAVSYMGWINCDRFYKEPQAEMEFDMPITLNNSQVQYFLLYESINGMIHSQVLCDENAKASVAGLPIGIKATMIGFVKKDGIIYQAKETFMIEAGKKQKLDFTVISEEELKKIFGRNVKA